MLPQKTMSRKQLGSRPEMKWGFFLHTCTYQFWEGNWHCVEFEVFRSLQVIIQNVGLHKTMQSDTGPTSNDTKNDAMYIYMWLHKETQTTNFA